MNKAGTAVSQVSIGRVAVHALLVFGLTAIPSFFVAFFGGAVSLENLGLGLRIAGALFGIFGFALSGFLARSNARLVHISLVAGGVWLLSFVNVVFYGMTFARWIGDAVGIAVWAAVGGGLAQVLARKRLTPSSISAQYVAEFERAAKLPVLWQITARQLVAAANLLRPRQSMAAEGASLYASNMPVLLLYGLAAENLVKAVLIASGTEAVQPDKKSGIRLSGSVQGHDLTVLFQRAGIPLADSDTDALKNLSWIVQGGRYPVGMRPGQHPDESAPQWFELTDLNRVVALLEALEDRLRSVGGSLILERTDLGQLGLGAT